MSKLTNRKAKLRLYDGTGTPYYLELDLDTGDFNGPIGQPLTEEILVLNRGVMDANAHYIEGPDDALLAAVPLSFSVMVRDDNQTVYILDWLKAGQDGGTTTVNSNTVTTTKEDTQRDGSNNNPAFDDSYKLTFNVEYLMETGGTDLGFKYAEVYFPLEQQNISEGEDGITLQLNGMCYGTITRITSFTGGTDVEA
jgi:hypothetical protein